MALGRHRTTPVPLPHLPSPVAPASYARAPPSPPVARRPFLTCLCLRSCLLHLRPTLTCLRPGAASSERQTLCSMAFLPTDSQSWGALPVVQAYRASGGT